MELQLKYPINISKTKPNIIFVKNSQINEKRKSLIYLRKLTTVKFILSPRIP